MNVVVDRAVFNFFRNEQKEYFLWKFDNQGPAAHGLAAIARNTRRAHQMTRNLVNFLLAATNRTFAPYGLQFRIQNFIVSSMMRCAMGSNCQSGRMPSIATLPFSTMRVMKRRRHLWMHMSGTSTNLHPQQRMPHCVREHAADFCQIPAHNGRSKCWRDVSISRCVREAWRRWNRNEWRGVGLGGSHPTYNVFPLVHGLWLMSHELSHSFALEHVNGSHIMNPSAQNNFHQNYLEHDRDSETKLSEFIWKLLKEETVAGSKLRNCLT